MSLSIFAVKTHGALSSAWLGYDLLRDLPEGVIDAMA